MRTYSKAALMALFLLVGTGLAIPNIAQASGGGEQALNLFDFSHWIGNNPDPTPPLIALLINFGLLIWLVVLILKAPLRRKFKDRREDLERAFNEARELRERAEKMLAEAERRSETIDLEMAKARGQILEAGKIEAERIVADAGDRAARLHADTKAMIGHEIALMAGKLKRQVVAEVLEAAEQLIRDEVSVDDTDRLSKEYVDSIIASSVTHPPGSSSN